MRNKKEAAEKKTDPSKVKVAAATTTDGKSSLIDKIKATFENFLIMLKIKELNLSGMH